MQAYIVSRPVTVRASGQTRWLGAAASFQTPHVSEVQIAAAGEIEAVTEQLGKDHPGVETRTLIKGLAHRHLAKWPHFPMPLGRQPTDDGTSDVPVLPQQLQALRDRHPNRRHFRLLIANGFGTNLGDTLTGLAAFRNALVTIREHLPLVTVDVLLGWQVRDSVVQMYLDCEGIGTVFRQGPTLQALSRYQGAFDTSALITLPRYGQMPHVDWYLWWLGLDPREIPPASKRNVACLDETDMLLVRERLAAVPGKRILLNPMASEPLRRMTLPAVTALADALLARDPEIRVVFDQPVAIQHPRVVHLADIMDSPGRVSALVAQVDGVITPDTFLQHIADALDTPCCTVVTSLPADHFRYYPYGRTLELPGVRDLPGWGKVKVSREQWKSMQADYNRAWDRLPAQEVLDALDQAIAAAGSVNHGRKPPPMYRVAQTRSRMPLVSEPHPQAGSLQPRGQIADPRGERLVEKLLELGEQILANGDTVVLLGAGSGDFALSLAHRIAPAGWLVAIEPRRLVHQLLCANLIRSGLTCAQAHWAEPVGSSFRVVQRRGLALDEDHLATAAANQLVEEPVPAWPLDALQLNHCRLIVLQRPIPMLEALAAAAATIERLRPTILAADVSPDQLPLWRAALEPHRYDIRIMAPQSPQEAQARGDRAPAPVGWIVIAEPTRPAPASPAGAAP